MPSNRAMEALFYHPRGRDMPAFDELQNFFEMIEYLIGRDLPSKADGRGEDDGETVAFNDTHTTTEEELYGHAHDHDHDHDGATSGFDAVNDTADARPDHAGGGKKKTDSEDGSTDVKGKGQGKTKNQDNNDTTDGGATGGSATDGGATEGSATDGSTTDGSTTDGSTTDGSTTDGGTSGGTTTDGGTSGTGEVNPGSTDQNIHVTGMDTPEGYNIEIEFFGDWSDEMRQAAISAGELLSDLITMDVVSYNGIDDLRIQAYNEAIDGTGGAVAQGGWIQLRNDPMKMVAEGGIRVDSADADSLLATGKLHDAILHEMLHAMGFGTTWAYTGLTEEIGGVTRFTGQTAIEAYNTEFADIAANDPYSDQGVPLSGDDAHWSQSSFGSEVMSPTLGSNEYLSDMTLAALEDMGYETVYPDEEEELAQEQLFF